MPEMTEQTEPAEIEIIPVDVTPESESEVIEVESEGNSEWQEPPTNEPTVSPPEPQPEPEPEPEEKALTPKEQQELRAGFRIQAETIRQLQESQTLALEAQAAELAAQRRELAELRENSSRQRGKSPNPNPPPSEPENPLSRSPGKKRRKRSPVNLLQRKRKA